MDKSKPISAPMGANPARELTMYLGRRGFRRYRRRAVQCAKDILNRARPHEFDEPALPAYSHSNFLMRWLFWERLGRVLAYCQEHVPAGSRVLDFGCGAGMLLPLLAARGYSLTGVDIDLQLTPDYLKEFGVDGVVLCEPQRMSELPPASYDLVVALDVLEHIEDLDQTIDQLQRLLRPGGSMLVCGPTENILYKAGRWLSGIGSGTQNHYHVSNISDIQNTFQRRFDTRTVATLVPLLPFFRIFVARSRSSQAGQQRKCA